MSPSAVVSLRLVVKDPHGLHARPCAAIAREMRRFRCDVTVVSGGRVADARSIMELLSLAAELGTEIELRSSGEDAVECIQVLAGILAGSRSIE